MQTNSFMRTLVFWKVLIASKTLDLSSLYATMIIFIMK